MTEKFNEITQKNFSLDGLRGIVTGGSSGIGKSISLTLADAGAEVFVFSRTGKFKTNEEDRKNVTHYKVDIINETRSKILIDKIGEKRIDFLINNAGVSERMRAEKVTKELWEKINKVNIDAAFMLSKAAYPFLKKSENSGRIINITSMASHLAFSEVVPYSVSKTALLGLTRSLAVEWANDNILVNSVSPGWIKTDLLDNVADEERERKILNRMPLHKYGTPEDIANMVWYLVAPVSKYITGQDFAVDGGALIYGY